MKSAADRNWDPVFPPALAPGDRIALVAPASPFAAEQLEAACDWLRGSGYHPVPGKSIYRRQGYLAGSEAERAEDLIQALTDPAVAAVFAIRGGYGSSRLLPWLPFSMLKRQPKIFLGYSDNTFLHLALWKEMHWVTFHGPHVVDLGEGPDSRRGELLEALGGARDFSWGLDGVQVLRPGVAAGVLLGGNLTCLAHLLMTPYFPAMEGVLLMIEDRGEALYRLDRVLTQLLLAGVFDKISGLILGQFRDCAGEEQICNLVRDRVKTFQFPVITGLPFGHGATNDVLPLGAAYSLNTYDRTLHCLQRPFAG
jgi:muramoyltetrapeptide carboxypeptidase